MNLIEQLGGYEKAKEKMDDICHTLDNSELLGGGDAREGLYERLESIDKALLEYRRQHNIFEVGDKVVFGSGLNADLFTIKSKPKKKNGVLLLPVILSNGSWFDLMEQFVRHATDEEIKAGKRLEVKSEN